LSRVNGLEVAETVVHSKIKEITHAFLETFLEGVKSDIETSIILKDIRQKLSRHDIQLEELKKTYRNLILISRGNLNEQLKMKQMLERELFLKLNNSEQDRY
jgi:hypothetical protein